MSAKNANTNVTTNANTPTPAVASASASASVKAKANGNVSAKTKANNIEDLYALTPTQQGMLVHHLEGGEDGIYFEQLLFTIQGALDLDAFGRAWQTLLDRHTALRTAFAWQNLDKPVQGVARHARLPISVLDWRALSPQAQSERLQAHLAEERRRGFDLAKPPLMRLSVIQLAERTYRVIWHYHHLLLDGWSSSIAFNELFECYRAYSRGVIPALPPATPFKHYLAWLQSQDTAQADAYWRTMLHDFDTPTALLTRTGRQSQRLSTAGIGEMHAELSLEDHRRLQQFCRDHQLTASTLVQAAWAIVLSRHTSERDVAFGITVSGRPANLPGVERMVGMFINTLPCACRCRRWTICWHGLSCCRANR